MCTHCVQHTKQIPHMVSSGHGPKHMSVVRDVIWDLRNPFPFLCQLHLQICQFLQFFSQDVPVLLQQTYKVINLTDRMSVITISQCFPIPSSVNQYLVNQTSQTCFKPVKFIFKRVFSSSYETALPAFLEILSLSYHEWHCLDPNFYEARFQRWLDLGRGRGGFETPWRWNL